ncbi:sugar kinase [Candidatus Bipolaricaulota bacterium]|nr:sugar kinase [Candidatus Bipolaricaulota bacterium]
MKIITVGEMLVEVMRKDVNSPLDQPGEFVGPFPSGAPAIFIDAVAKLGISSEIIGGTGDDEFGDCLNNRLEKDGVSLSGVKVDEKLSTGVAFVSYFADGSRKFLYHMGNSAAGVISKEDIDESYFEEADLLHINGSSLAMSKQMRRACYEGVEMAKEKGLDVSFDPNLRTELLGVEKTREICSPVLDSCELFIPGADELRGITGASTEKEAVESVLKKGAEVVAVKDGRAGCKIYSQNQTFQADAFDVEEVDPTGAGDAFSAAIAVGWLEEMDLEDLSLFANAVGGRAVTGKGPMEGLPDRKQVQGMIE